MFIYLSKKVRIIVLATDFLNSKQIAWHHGILCFEALHTKLVVYRLPFPIIRSSIAYHGTRDKAMSPVVARMAC